jgi:glutamate synthase (NADPH/NADH)
MGNDAPLACMATAPRVLFDYFRQLFAQVTNPPIDPIRESIVMSLECYVGAEGNLLEMNQNQCHRLLLTSPVLSIEEVNALKRLDTVHPDWPSRTIDITFDKAEGVAGYQACLDRVCAETSTAIAENIRVIVLSDRNVGVDRVAISSAIATGGVHHHLVRNKQRSKVALIVETGEAREVHHVCVLVGYGADGVCPYLCLEAMLKVRSFARYRAAWTERSSSDLPTLVPSRLYTSFTFPIAQLRREGLLKVDLTEEQVIKNYKAATDGGILKVMSKMGISTLQSYKGAQIFEALGLAEEVIDRCFVGTLSLLFLSLSLSLFFSLSLSLSLSLRHRGLRANTRLSYSFNRNRQSNLGIDL